MVVACGATLIAIHHPETYVPGLKKEFNPYGKTFFGFYIGAQDPHPGFVADNELLDRELTAAAIRHVFELYQGGHDGAFWRQHQHQWLAAAAERLDPQTAAS